MEESDLSSSLDLRGLPVRLRYLKPLLERAARELFCEHGIQTYALSVSLVGDPEIGRINRDALKRSGPTDVIAFDLSEDGLPYQKVGDVYISKDTASENSSRFKVSEAEEIFRLFVHGVLHVIGYSDADPAAKREMAGVQEKTVKRFSCELAR